MVTRISLYILEHRTVGETDATSRTMDQEIVNLLFQPKEIDTPLHPQQKAQNWIDIVSSRVSELSEEQILQSGYGALHDFLQANITGPPLNWSPAQSLLSPFIGTEQEQIRHFQEELISSLCVDGETIYRLTPHIALFYLAKITLDHDKTENSIKTDILLARIRVNVWHQRLLSENAPTLQKQIYGDLAKYEARSSPLQAEYLIERAAINTLHGRDKEAREDLKNAAAQRSFEFALTGRLGKRTKFQQKDLSQLVVLARGVESPEKGLKNHGYEVFNDRNDVEQETPTTQGPNNLNLDDDTLLESISFSKDKKPDIKDEEALSPSLAALDPANQPPLQPMDAVILLATASSVTNTSPQDGLTREETLPYATRVLDSPSTNWQIYTQALIVRSRIEGYRSRTAERGLLQLQAIVDQVIADTQEEPLEASFTNGDKASSEPITPSTFLPRPKQSESAPAEERLRYIHQLASPTRWDLEAELASRWVSMGGLRTALEIYERLEMWAEAALCWAAQDREDEATKIVKKQLYEVGEVSDARDYSERSPLPNDAPRLFCILGDLSKNPKYYERAWNVSNKRYARAQRSLGRLYFANKNLEAADEAYTKSLRINHLNHATWFALGCVRLQLEDWPGAVDAFGRAVKIEESDAETWSNMAAALMRLSADTAVNGSDRSLQHDSTGDERPKITADDDQAFMVQQKNTRAAFQSLKRAAALKRDSHRIWQNLLTVSIQLAPPPYADIVIAQTRLIEILGKTQGEKSIDVPVMEALVSYLIRTPDDGIPALLRKSILTLLLDTIPPLLTTSPKLHSLLARLHTYLSHPAAALASYEKAWRAVLKYSSTDWENGPLDNKNSWHQIVDLTTDLVDAYESFGPQPREGGLGEGAPVEKGWKFKARSALRSVLGRGKAWEGDEGWGRLKTRMNDFR